MNEVRTVVVSWVFIASFLLSFGCSPIQPVTQEVKPPTEEQLEQLPQPPELKYLTHTIKWSGENIIRISQWYTGSGRNWLRIVEANPSIDSRRIQIGDSILIPEDLLKTREEMPRSFRVPVASPKNKKPEAASEPLPESSEDKKPSTASEPAPKASEVDFFGPIDIESQNDSVEATETYLPLETIE